jgi:hypothetical protein
MVRDDLTDIKKASRIAARSAALAVDQGETARRGFLVLDEDLARSQAEEFFFNNLNRFKAEEGELDIYVINDAPGTFNLHDKTHFFQSNGVAVGYHYEGEYIFSAAEIDDR